MREVLRQPGMRRLLAGEATSMFGDWVLVLVLGIWIRTLGGSYSVAGAVMLAMAAPSLVSPLFGWVVDRFRRRPFLIGANLLSAAALTPLLLVRDHGDIWIVYLVAVFYGISQTVTGGAFAGLIKKLVPDELLGSANGLFAGVRQGFRLCGPLIGAGLFAAFGGWAVALVDIVSFVVAAGALATIRLAETRPARGELHWLDEVSAGLRHIYRTSMLRNVTAAFAVSMLAIGAVDTMIYAYVDGGLHKPPTFVGVLVTVQGLGVLVGALFAGRIMARLGEIAVCGLGILTCAIAIAVAAYPSVAVALVAMPFAGVGNTFVGVAFMTLLQRRTPGELIGRVSAATDMAVGGAAALSMAVGATLVAFVDYKIMFVVIGAILFVTSGWLLRLGQADRATAAVALAAE